MARQENGRAGCVGGDNKEVTGDEIVSGPCRTCLKRWWGWWGNKPSEWHCRKDLTKPVHELPVIGNDKDLARASGCKDWSDEVVLK